ncbi:unnamed protein product [Zymoseptoria tritici ST99CH_3D1]|uniref:Secreted protein n=2 Tax=Zymoseptoria tritici TaxID=1047171 RepID=A0A1X7S033_ZYMT9|nr:unnamed protein product [Zymoseptoria tritici ST99CH_3D7]SMR55379.1 unnamed protein product [Zymoseptoria tritici ST99CH_1E4]SMR57756.1 unnamed protein product [Zymoseptoria tritici ST99CH_3D1]
MRLSFLTGILVARTAPTSGTAAPTVNVTKRSIASRTATEANRLVGRTEGGKGGSEVEALLRTDCTCHRRGGHRSMLPSVRRYAMPACMLK